MSLALHTIQPIALCHSPYKQKFSIPRQAQLAPSAQAQIELLRPYNDPAYIEGIEQFSHLWLTFIFHENLAQGYKPSVRPPRLGGAQKMGVFATRSTFRPNGLGQSVVKLESVVHHQDACMLHVSGLDLLDKTPIVDIKPYLPYADSLPEAQAGIAQEAPKCIEVAFTEQAEFVLIQLEPLKNKKIKQWITEVLSQDPRPAHRKHKIDHKIYFSYLDRFNIHWQAQEKVIQVLHIEIKSNEL